MRVKALLLIIITAGVFLVTSCHKGLGLQPQDVITDEQLWKDQSLVVLYTNNFYSQLTSGFSSSNQITGGTWLLSSITDDALTAGNTSAKTIFNNSTYDAYHPAVTIWNPRYTYIRRANTYLSKIDQVPGDQQLNKRLKAEVRFLRAYYYYDLVSYYGAVPVITVAQNDLSDTTSLFPVRDSLAACQNFIVSQLDSAANDLPSTYPTADLGRITKQAAWALKCRVQMMRASASMLPQDWAVAAATAKSIMDMGANSLITVAGTDSASLAKNYSNIFSVPNNAEMILSVQHTYSKDELGTSFDLNTSSPYYGGTANNCPTQNLVDDYEMRGTGKAITDGTSGYDANNPYAGRDPRFYATILFDGASFKNRTMQMYTGGQDMVDGTGKAFTNATPTGYYLRKFTNENINPTDPNARSGYNWPLIRYAEILLNYAESQNEAVGPDASVQAAVNAIRSRAGMPSLSGTLTQAQMRTAIWHERRIELAFEDHRYWDAKRWGMATTWFNGTGTPSSTIRKVTITRNAQTGVKTYNMAASNQVFYTRVFTQRNYLFPIPQTEIDIPGNKLAQNPGW